MLVLALDSATAACSVALWENGVLHAHRLAVMARGQAEALIPMVETVMKRAGLGFADLDLIATTVGPGTFTGIRIGLAAVRGLALATGLPIAGVTTTEAVAAAIPEAERHGRAVLVALDSKRDDPWAQAFAADLTPLSPPAALTPLAAAALASGPAIVAGDAADRILPLMNDAVAAATPGHPDAAVVAALGARHWRNGTALPPHPLYLRPADVTLPAAPSP